MSNKHRKSYVSSDYLSWAFVKTFAGTRHFAILDGTRGGGGNPLRVSKVSVVELSGKDHRIALDEYSRLVVHFLTLGQNLTQL